MARSRYGFLVWRRRAWTPGLLPPKALSLGAHRKESSRDPRHSRTSPRGRRKREGIPSEPPPKAVTVGKARWWGLVRDFQPGSTLPGSPGRRKTALLGRGAGEIHPPAPSLRYLHYLPTASLKKLHVLNLAWRPPAAACPNLPPLPALPSAPASPLYFLGPEPA